ncbi:MAG: leucine-rich repeat protein [Bacilli bacterium]|nr:leucine-rich repeat protein [Bacilli bacterium]
MKKTILITPIMLTLFLVSCNGGGDVPPSVIEHFVTFECNGGTPHIDTQRVKDGEKAVKPDDPRADFGTFIDWCSDETCLNHYDFNTPVTSDLTLYAHYDKTVDFAFIGEHCTINGKSEFVETHNYNEFVTYEIDAESAAYSIEDHIDFAINGVPSDDYTYNPDTHIFTATCKGDASLTIASKKMPAMYVSLVTEENITPDPDYVVKFDCTTEDDGPFIVDWGDGTIDSKCIHPYLATTKNPKIIIYGNLSEISFSDIDGPYALGNQYITQITFPECLDSLPDYALNGISQLNNFHLPSKMTSIGSYAFSGCTNLRDCVLPTLESKTIEEGTFAGCSKLETALIQNGITTIGEKAFINCGNLGELVLRKDVILAKNDAFKNCTLLRLYCFNTESEITLENIGDAGVAEIIYGCASKNIDTTGQYSCLVKKNALQQEEITILECLKLNDTSGKVVIPKELTINIKNKEEVLPVISIGYQAFSGKNVRGLVTEVDFKENPKISLDAEAFRGCSNLKTLTFEPSYANRFDGEHNLYGLKFGDHAFMNCYALAGDIPVTLYYDTIASMGSDVFKMDNETKCQVWCEEETKAEEWQDDWNASGITKYGLCYTGNDVDNKYKINLYHDNQKTSDNGKDEFYIGIASKIDPKVTEWEVESELKISDYGRAPNSVEVRVIESLCMQGNNDIQKVDAPSVTIIKEKAFDNCSNLKSFAFSKTIEEIGADALAHTALTDITLDKENAKITVFHPIGGGGVKNQTIEKITLPNGLKSIDNNAFSWFQALKTIDYDAEKCQLEYIGKNAFTETVIAIDNLRLKQLKYVDTNAFDTLITGRPSIKSITFPSIITCGNNAFSGAGLESVTLGADLATLGYRVFWNNPNLKVFDLSLVEDIPDFVDTLGIEGECKIYVPAALLEAFKSDKSWSQYANQIFPAPSTPSVNA